jgi:hypothetical protein
LKNTASNYPVMLACLELFINGLSVFQNKKVLQIIFFILTTEFVASLKMWCPNKLHKLKMCHPCPFSARLCLLIPNSGILETHSSPESSKHQGLLFLVEPKGAMQGLVMLKTATGWQHWPMRDAPARACYQNLR